LLDELLDRHADLRLFIEQKPPKLGREP